MEKNWEEPKLIVLVRGRSEEAVLEHCKYGHSEGYPSSYEGGCKELSEGPCTNCSGSESS